MKTFLHVGCGAKRQDRTTPEFARPGWRELRLDIDARVEPDIVASMTDMAAVATGSVDALFSSHNLEHLYAHEVPVALREFCRVLKDDGFAVVTCPDLQAAAELIAADRLLEPVYRSPAGPVTPFDILYGFRPELARGNHHMAHRSGFTLSVLRGTLLGCGFARVAGLRRPAPFFELWTVASKGECSDERLRELARRHFPARGAASRGPGAPEA